MASEQILTQIDDNEAVNLLRKMLQIKTINPPGNEKDLAELIAKELNSFGMEAEVVDLGNNRGNVIGRLRGTGERKALLFNGHLDTVPPGDVEWDYGPYSGHIQDGKIYGRGSSDMKGGLAAMIMAAKAVKKSGLELKGDLIFCGTAGEEADSIGAFDFLNKGGLKDIEAIIIGEPSSCGINISEKGALWLEITTFGKTAHGAFPDRGINAITCMNALINEFLNYKFKFSENELLGRPTINIATIQGGVKTNVVPDKCVITIDIRTVPGMEHSEIIKDFEGIIAKLQERIPDLKATVDIVNDRPAVETATNHPFVKMAQEVIQAEFKRLEKPKGVNFYTDAAVFLPATNLPAILYGPGDAEMAHQPNENISIERLSEALQFYAAMIERYLVL